MEKCYQGIVIPAPIEEPCGNDYISTNCVNTPSQILYLDIPAGASQTLINIKIVAALKATNEVIVELTERVEIAESGLLLANQLIQDLTERVEILENI